MESNDLQRSGSLKRLLRGPWLVAGCAAVFLLTGYELTRVPFLEMESRLAPVEALRRYAARSLVPAPAPDLAATIPALAQNPLAAEALRNVLDGDEAAASRELPDWPAPSGDIPERGGPRLRARAWYAVDDDTGEVLLAHHADLPFPIASISKLMGALIYADTAPDLEEPLTVLEEDKEFIQITRSRLLVGYRCLARDLLFQSLLPSDNRATIALLRQTQLPLEVFREAMNRRARILRLEHAHFEEPTGLDESNVASARDITVLLEAALSHPLLSHVLNQKEHYYYREDAPRLLGARSSNRLSFSESWDVIASKTGFTLAAGSCLVLKTRLESGRTVSIGLLGASGEKGRYPVAEAIKRYLEGT